MKFTTKILYPEWAQDRYDDRYLIRMERGIMWRKPKETTASMSRGFLRISKNGIPFFTFDENGDTEMVSVERTKERNSFVDFEEWRERMYEEYPRENHLITRDRKNFYVFRIEIVNKNN